MWLDSGFQPDPSGWKVVFITPTGELEVVPMPGWLIQEDQMDGLVERRVVASYVEDHLILPVHDSQGFWCLLAPGEEFDVSDEDLANDYRRLYRRDREDAPTVS